MAREIDVLTLQERLGTRDFLRLTVVTRKLLQELSREGVFASCYVVGSTTFSPVEYQKHYGESSQGRVFYNDIDVIVAAHDRELLKPDRENYWGCPFTATVNKVLPELFTAVKAKEPSHLPPVLGTPFESMGRIPFAQYGRPNIRLEFAESLPIHLVVSYRNPSVFKLSREGRDQKVYSELIEQERKIDAPFCVF